MRDRLEKIIAGYEELQNKLSDPAILNNHAEYTKLTKEYSNQGPLVAKAREYLQACDDIDDAKEMLDDPDMRELAQETPPMRKTSSSRFALPPVATRPPFSQAICTRCTCASAIRSVGRPKLWM